MDIKALFRIVATWIHKQDLDIAFSSAVHVPREVGLVNCTKSQVDEILVRLNETESAMVKSRLFTKEKVMDVQRQAEQLRKLILDWRDFQWPSRFETIQPK